MLKLYIGNKNYSSWSMRPWVLLRQFAIEFEEAMVRFDSFEPGSTFKTIVAAVSPAGRVPVLVDERLAVWDTLAIAEYLAERHPEKSLWPSERQARARARSVCAEMHAGFSALRSHCPMNVEASLPQIGALGPVHTVLARCVAAKKFMRKARCRSRGGPRQGSATPRRGFLAATRRERDENSATRRCTPSPGAQPGRRRAPRLALFSSRSHWQ